MNFRYIILIAVAISLSACKKTAVKIEEPKPEESPKISYVMINRKLNVSDPRPMSLDVNNDGVVDCSYFLQYVVLGGKVHLYAGVNPVLGSAISGDEPNDNVYLNMGAAHSFALNQAIKAGLPWTEEFSFLSDRVDELNGNKSYAGSWSSGEPKMMSIRIPINGKMHYAWAQLKFDRATEELTLIDAAWNTVAEQEIKAGAR